MKLGSLFSGSGSFELAGLFNGIEPVFNSEVEPFAVAVTDKRLPNVKQLGDVTKISGAKVEPVDIITFGSPCQDLSIAGKKLGIHDGTRSSLFFEAIRIIKEMRNATANQFPRFAVWENVKHALSSHNGADFQAVLQAFCEVAGAEVHVPLPQVNKGKWATAGTIVGDGFSIAWRVYNAVGWGVPQRRERVFLIADFGSERAGEILFDASCESGDPPQSYKAWQEFAYGSEGSAGRGNCDCLYVFKERAGKPGGGKGILIGEGRAFTLSTHVDQTICCKVWDARGNGDGITSPTITGDHNNRITDYTAVIVEQKPETHYYSMQRFDEFKESAAASTLKQRDYKDVTDIVVEEREPKLNRKYIVRRLTPTESLSLQGLPKWWCDGVKGRSDTAVYRLSGNGLALPCAIDVICKISKAYEMKGAA